MCDVINVFVQTDYVNSPQELPSNVMFSRDLITYNITYNRLDFITLKRLVIHSFVTGDFRLLHISLCM